MKPPLISAGVVLRRFAVCAVLFGVAADAPAITLWPTDWLTNMGTDPGAFSGTWRPLLGTNGQFYTDAVDDVDPHSVDIVGGTDHHGNGPYPAGFYYIDTTNIMFRMRVDGDPRSYAGATTNFDQYVWGVFFNTDADTDVDWALQIDNKTDGNLEFVTNTVGGPLPVASAWDVDTIAPHVPVGSLDFTTNNVDPLFRIFDATSIDGSHFHSVAPQSDDYFIDMAIPWTIFTNHTGLGIGTPFEIALATAADHQHYIGVNVNKDSPEVYWSSTVTIPEPSAGLVIVPLVGLAILVARRRRNLVP